MASATRRREAALADLTKCCECPEPEGIGAMAFRSCLRCRVNAHEKCISDTLKRKTWDDFVENLQAEQLQILDQNPA